MEGLKELEGLCDGLILGEREADKEGDMEVDSEPLNPYKEFLFLNVQVEVCLFE